MRFGRRFQRLSTTAVIVFMITGFWPSVSSAAVGDELLSAKMRVGQSKSLGLYGFGKSSYGSLTDTTFNHGGTVYTIDVLVYDAIGDQLRFRADQSMPISTRSGLTLTVGGVDFAVGSAEIEANSPKEYIWAGPGLNWGVGDTVTVSLSFQETAPAQPTGLVAVAGDTEVTLGWDSPTDDAPSVTGFQYQQTNSIDRRFDDDQWVGISGSDSRTVSHTVTGLINDITYVFWVRAVNENGESPASDPVKATPLFAEPAQPTGLVAVAGDAAVTLGWDSPTDDAPSVTGFQYQQTNSIDRRFDDDQWMGISGSDTWTVSHTVTGLINDTTYVFWVRAVNENGESPASDPVKATPLFAVPAQPTGLVAVAGDAAVTLGWDSPTGDAPSVIGFQYQLASADRGFDDDRWVGISGSDAWTVSHTVTGLSNDIAYVFWVRAVNESGESPASDPVKATPLFAQPAQPVGLVAAEEVAAAEVAVRAVTPPNKPTGLAATAGNTQVSLSWDDPSDSDIDYYQLGVNDFYKLVSSDPAASDELGFSVAIAGDTMVVGAPLRRRHCVWFGFGLCVYQGCFWCVGSGGQTQRF